MLSGYNIDRKKDLDQNEYNPLNNGKWNYEEMRKKLIEGCNIVKNDLLDSIMTTEGAERSIWAL